MSNFFDILQLYIYVVHLVVLLNNISLILCSWHRCLVIESSNFRSQCGFTVHVRKDTGKKKKNSSFDIERD